MGSKLIEVLADLVLLHAVEQTEAMMGGAEATKLTRPQKLNSITAKQRERQRFPLGRWNMAVIVEGDLSEPFVMIQRMKKQTDISTDQSISHYYAF